MSKGDDLIMAYIPNDYERTFKIHRDAYNYKGVLAYLKVPSNLHVNMLDDYLIWYVGFDDNSNNKVEGGISYTKKYTGSPQFRKFLNYNGIKLYNEPMATQPSPGDIIKIKLVKSNSDSYGNCSVSLYIADNLVTTKSVTINNLVDVKLVHGTEGYPCTYDDAQFQYAKYQISDGTWYNWTAGYEPVWSTGAKVKNIYVDCRINPMKTYASNQ
jgi:hypothetical protein